MSKHPAVRGRTRSADADARHLLRAGLVAVVAVLAMAGTACGAERGAGTNPGDATPSAGTGGLGNAPGGGPAPPPATPPPPPPPPGQPPPASPIEVYEVAVEPDCDNNQVVLSWNVAGVDNGMVTISIEGGGVFDEYPAEHTEGLPFACDGDDKRYMIAAVVGGVTVTETIVVPGRTP
jgi:hypothetical protein